jgi:[glutamine synthetase] adenylyltransferase / [glutamine synthetase]-adenylyl-L-tyrosine phosphorylase
MVRSPNSLSELARAGFVELTQARETLQACGLPAEWFVDAPDADRALAFLAHQLEANPRHTKDFVGNDNRATSLILAVGASSGVATFLARRLDQWNLFDDPLTAPLSHDQLVAGWGERVSTLPKDEATTLLRVLYRRELVRLAVFDLSHSSPSDIVDVVAAGLSDLASAALDVALQIARKDAGWPADEVPLAIIGMGKLGARELNYLSDVDVIYVTDPPEGSDPDDVVRRATHLAVDLQRILMEFGVEPGLWEVDANLRPEGKDGALVRTLSSHLAYYERWAKDWEFQALIKSRPVAGDRDVGQRYREGVEPMIWAASSRPGFVEQVQRMRERVTDHIPNDQVDVQLKLGPGGLRDVEFTIQLLQLVHGGTDPQVRRLATLESLQALSVRGYVGRPEAQEFDRAYRILRTLEHRLQLSSLTRTHLMPRDEESLRVLARATKLADNADDLVERWRGVQREVRSLHERLFYRPLLSAVAGLGADQGIELTSEQAIDRLRASGYVDPEGALRHITALTQGVSRRAQIHRTLLPVILRWLADGTDPDRGLLAFRRLSDDLGETNWFLRMLRDSSGAASRLARVLGTSGYVTALFERIPDGASWLDDGDALTPRTRESLRDEMDAVVARYQGDLPGGSNALKQARRRELLRVSMASILGAIDARAVGNALTDLHASYLHGALGLVGVPEGLEFAVIGMGRFGGAELGFSSDADVLWVFRDVGIGDQASQAALGVVRRVTEITEDVLFPFELDAGLRPEGKNGPLARSLDAYRQYYEKWALGWESQALLRQTPLAGSPQLLADFAELADSVRYPEEFPPDAVREIRRIKARVEGERLPQGADPTRHLKLGRGSLSDVEWLVQLYQLVYGRHIEALRTVSTLDALRVLGDEGFIPEPDVAVLSEAWLLASAVRNALTLFGSPGDVLPHDRSELEGAARLLGYPPRSASRLEEHYLRHTRLARQAFDRHFTMETRAEDEKK